MMISPNCYTDMHKDDTFEQLIAERDRLYGEIKELEKIAYTDERHGNMHPGPDVRYQMDLEYLAELCSFIEEKYNSEIVWGELEE